MKQNDLLKDFFLPDIKDHQVVNQYKKIMEWIRSNQHYTQQAKNKFMESNNADAFLIAVASTYNYTIVTHEKNNPNKKNGIPIPNAANEFNIRTIMIYDLLSQYAQGNFQLKI